MTKRQAPLMHDEQPPQALIDWLDETREKLSKGPLIRLGEPHKPYILIGYRQDGTQKQWRCLDAAYAEMGAAQLWATGKWARIEINGIQRY